MAPEHGLGLLPIRRAKAFSFVSRLARAILQYELCLIKGDFQVEELDGTVDINIPFSCCFPQRHLANNDYGWGLVWGHGFRDCPGNDQSPPAICSIRTPPRAGCRTLPLALHLHGCYATTTQGTTGQPVGIAVTWPAIDLIA